VTHTGNENAVELLQTLRDVMWETCGVVRTEEKLQQGLARLKAIKAAMANVDADTQMKLAQTLDLRASVMSAETTLRGALERRESRGAHQRADFPDVDEQLKVNFVTRLDENSNQVLSTQSVPPVPGELHKWLTDDAELEIKGRLLE
jgi:succinate dehydrogenase / fumarate reductase flavoprotein subunit